MKITQREREDVVILDLGGNLMGGPDADHLHEAVKSAIAEGKTKFLFNLARAKWINSLGLGTLIAAYKSICDANGRMTLTKVDERVRSILMITRLLILFDVYESEEEAVDAMTAAKAASG